jgi:hypothetical protein
MENICLLLGRMPQKRSTGTTYILMASIRENNNRQAAERGNRTFPLHNTNWPSICHGVTLCKMIYDQDNQVSDGDESHDARILQGIQAAQEG